MLFPSIYPVKFLIFIYFSAEEFIGSAIAWMTGCQYLCFVLTVNLILNCFYTVIKNTDALHHNNLKSFLSKMALPFHRGAFNLGFLHLLNL